MDGPPSSYSVSNLLAVVGVSPICAVTNPMSYTTFTFWLPGANINAVKIVSSLLRSCRSFTFVVRKL